ncbi:hypothetical protein B0H17DRAFT_1076595 [Mycena rosella]|uniref:Uncharacterized protein n=1 Tax=Mycena rosella TaxID=1033263 RepID=A0AAD7D638_MYCRO|nr:hypothetical protein B0H17DRAFT_1076595 [Mycena rosella]
MELAMVIMLSVCVSVGAPYVDALLTSFAFTFPFPFPFQENSSGVLGACASEALASLRGREAAPPRPGGRNSTG